MLTTGPPPGARECLSPPAINNGNFTLTPAVSDPDQ